jgi:hypothetical protein
MFPLFGIKMPVKEWHKVENCIAPENFPGAKMLQLKDI